MELPDAADSKLFFGEVLIMAQRYIYIYIFYFIFFLPYVYMCSYFILSDPLMYKHLLVS